MKQKRLKKEYESLNIFLAKVALLSLVSYICKENFKLGINNYRYVHNFVNFSRIKLRFTLFSSSSSLWFKFKKIKLNSGQSVEILRDGTRNGH